MSLNTGAKLGPYEIVALLGAGDEVKPLLRLRFWQLFV